MQLFTHLLSSYLQGMGDFFSALPWGGLGRGLQSAVFLPPTADFLNGQRPLFYRGGCCRHAAHGVGDGGDDKEENLFSDWRHHRHQKGEADNSRHGFLCLYHPILCPAAGNAFG